MSTVPGLETLDFRISPTPSSAASAPMTLRPVLVGVVGSGNLEVMLEPADAGDGTVEIRVETSARGFRPIWEAVVTDFQRRHNLRGVRVLINDMGATPAVVSLRLDQAVAEMKGRAQ